MAYPKTYPLDRYSFEYSVWYTEQQDRTLRLVLLSHPNPNNPAQGLSYSWLQEEALALYVQRLYGERWPRGAHPRPKYTRPRRVGKRWSITRGPTTYTSYGSRYTSAQDILLRRLRTEHGVAYADLADNSFGLLLPLPPPQGFGEPWPENPNRASMARIAEAARRAG